MANQLADKILEWLLQKQIIQQDLLDDCTEIIEPIAKQLIKKDITLVQFQKTLKKQLDNQNIQFSDLYQALNKDKNMSKLLGNNFFKSKDLNPEFKNQKKIEVKSSKNSEKKKDIKETQRQDVIFADKSLQLQHKDMFADYKRLPQGSLQKQLQKQIVFAFERKHNSIPSRFFDETQTKFQELMARIVREECANGDSSLTDTIKKCHQEKDMRYELLCVIRRKIMPINVLELVRLVDETEKVKAKIAKKNVLLMIGTTGSGKTTCILRFLGYRLRKVKCETLTTLSPATPVKPQHQSFYTSPQAKSVTRYINVAKIPEQMFDQELEDECKDLSICDSPGFGDSGGIEIDIANGVGLINALKQCKSVRIVVIFAKDSLYADRMNGITMVGQIISYLFKELNKSLLAGITLLFNKFVNSDDIEQFPKLVQNKIKNLKTENSANSNLKKFLQKMKSESEREENYVNPESQDFKNVLQNVIKTLPIKNVADSFQYSFALNTKLEIDNFITKYLEKVKGKFNAAQYQLASFYLSMLAALQKVLVGNNDLESKLREAENFVKAQSDEIYKAFENSLKDIVEEADSQRVYQNIKACIHKIVRVKRLFPTVESLVDRTLIDQQLSKVEGSLLLKLSQFDQKSSDRLLKTYKLFATSLREQAPGFEKKAIQTLIELYNTEVGVINELFKKEQFAEMGQPLRKAKFVYNFHSKIQNDKAKQLKYNQLIKQFNEKAKTHIESLNEFAETCNIMSFAKVQNEINIVTLIECLNLDLKVDIREQMLKFFKSIQEKCRDQINSLSQFMNAGQTSKKNSLQQLKRKKDKIKCLMGIGKTEQKLKFVYEATLRDIKNKSKESIQNLKQLTATIRKTDKIEELQSKLSRICSTRNYVIKSYDVLELKDEQDQSIINDFDDTIAKYIKKQVGNLNSIKTKTSRYSVDDNTTEEVINEWCMKINLFKNMKMIQTVSKQIENMQSTFQKIIFQPLQSFLNAMQKTIQEKTFLSISKLQNICSYTQCLQKMRDNNEYESQTFKDLDQKLRKLLEKRYKTVEDNIRQFLQTYKKSEPVPQHLKQPLTQLSEILARENIKTYISFNVNALLWDLKNKFQQLSGSFEQSYSEAIKKQDIDGLIKQLNNCQFFCLLEKLLKKEQNKQFFQPLRLRIKDFLKANAKSLEQQVELILSNDIPSIQFTKLAQIYSNNLILQTRQSKSIVILIQSQLQKRCIQQTKKLKVLNKQSENLQAGGKQLTQNLEQFYKLVSLLSGIQLVFQNQTGKKPISIQQKLIQTQFKTYFTLLKHQFGDCLHSLTHLKLSNSEESIKIVALIQAKINQCNQKGLSILKPLIDDYDAYINQQQKLQQNPSLSELKLKGILSAKLKNSLSTVDQKYISPEKFSIDYFFSRVYSYLIKKDKQNAHILDNNIALFFKKKIEHLKKNVKDQQFIKTSKQIQNAIDFLPETQKGKYSNILDSIMHQIEEENNKLVNSVSVTIQNIDKFYQSISKYLKNNDQVHKKLVDKLEQLYYAQCQKPKGMQEKVRFKLLFFNQFIKKNKENLAGDSRLIQKLSYIYRQEVTKAHQQSLQKIKKIQKILENHPNSPDLQDVTALLIQIFGVVKFINSPRMEIIQTSPETATSITDTTEKSHQLMHALYANYKKNYIQLEKVSCLESAEARMHSNIISFYVTIKAYTIYGKLTEKIKLQVKQFQLNETPFIKLKYVEKIMLLPNKTAILKKYELQLNRIKTQILGFQFWNDNKKNYSQNDVEKDLKKIFDKYQLLKIHKDFYHTYLMTDPKNGYDLQQLQTYILDEYIRFKDNAMEEIKNIFQNQNYESSELTKCFLVNSEKIIAKRFYFVDKVTCQRATRQVEDSKNNCFITLKKTIEAIIQDIIQIKRQNESRVRDQKEMYASQIKFANDQSSQQIERQTSMIIQDLDKQIQHQKDEKARMNLQNKKNQQVNSKKNSIKETKESKIRQINKIHDQKIQQLKSQMQDPLSKLAQMLIRYHKALSDIIYKTDLQRKTFKTILSQISKLGPRLINQLIEVISNYQDNNAIGNNGKQLLVEEEIFASYKNKKRVELTKANNIQYVTKNIRKILKMANNQFSPSEIKMIKEKYSIFQDKYKSFLESYRRSPRESTMDTLLHSCRNLGNKLSPIYMQNKPSVGDQKIELLAYIFSIWTIIKCEKSQDQVEYTIQPHPAQIVALILLLGMVTDQQKIENRLAQVLTGEGKSLVLSGLSCYLALVGFQVKCACYSQYLSARDYESFLELFKRLDVSDNIKYGTFPELCEQILTIGKETFSKLVYDIIMKEQSIFGLIKEKFGMLGSFLKRALSKTDLTNDKTILIIDEVDVFFDEQYFGSSYCPSINLTGQAVNNFLLFVWNQVQTKKQKASVKHIIASQQFKKLVKEYKNLEDILQNQVHGMVTSALSWKHTYYIVDQKIVYKDNDTISTKISYGYKTVFANIYQYQQPNSKISGLNYNDALKITLATAQFSYAFLPAYFRNIIGVTGTLQVVPRFKKEQLVERFKIQEQFTIPSAFGMEVRRQEQYTIVKQKQSYYKKIIQDIEKVQNNRPIIVFFKDTMLLNEFYSRPEYKQLIKKTFVLNEQHGPEERKVRVQKATHPGKITFMTASFGRGTDFVIHDKKVKADGGLHVIQTFLSLEQSEQVQTKGRTARQKDKGTYHCIIEEGSLEQLELKIENFNNKLSSEDIHKVLKQAREKRMDKLAISTKDQLKVSDDKHREVIKVFTKENLSQTEVLKYLGQLNQCPEIFDVNNVVRTVLGMDATGSMGCVLRKACNIIQTSFQRVYKILEQKGVKSGVEVQIMIYRNYDCNAEQILESTTFENTPENLKKFLQKVSASGGWGNEAVQIFMQAVNKSPYKIDQVILIGDAAANTIEEVRARRSSKGQSYWNPHHEATNFQKQMNIFLQKNIPLHTFYVAAQKFFRDVSIRSKGKSDHFNLAAKSEVEENEQTQKFTAFVVQNILNIIGQRQKNPATAEELIKAYQKQYKCRKMYM